MGNQYCCSEREKLRSRADSFDKYLDLHRKESIKPLPKDRNLSKKNSIRKAGGRRSTRESLKSGSLSNLLDWNDRLYSNLQDRRRKPHRVSQQFSPDQVPNIQRVTLEKHKTLQNKRSSYSPYKSQTNPLYSNHLSGQTTNAGDISDKLSLKDSKQSSFQLLKLPSLIKQISAYTSEQNELLTVDEERQQSDLNDPEDSGRYMKPLLKPKVKKEKRNTIITF